MIAADTITAGQNFTIDGKTYTAVTDARFDKLNDRGGYKVEVTTEGDSESFYRLFGMSDMVDAA